MSLFPITVPGWPVPTDVITIKEGTLYTVPSGHCLVMSAYGRSQGDTFPSGTVLPPQLFHASVFIDSDPVMNQLIDPERGCSLPLPGPIGLVAKADEQVVVLTSTLTNYGRIWGWLLPLK